MATYTNQEIKTLTQQATSTPQFSRPQANVLSGIADIASVGLQLYGRNQAREELADARLQQEQELAAKAQRGKDIARESNRYANISLELAANTNISPTALASRKTEHLRELENTYGSEFAAEVRKSLSSMTGLTSGSLIDSAQKEALRKQREQQATAEAEEERTLDVMEAGVWTGRGLTQEQVQSMTPPEQAQILADARKAKVEQEIKAQDFKNKLDQYNVDGKEIKKVTDAFVSATLPQEANKLNVELQSALQAVPLSPTGSLNLEGIFATLAGFEAGIPTTISSIVKRGEELNVALPPEASSALTKQLKDTVNVYRDIYSQKGVAEAFKSKMDVDTFTRLNSALADPKTRGPASVLTLKLATGANFDGAEVSDMVTRVVEAAEEGVKLTGDRTQDKNTLNSIIKFTEGSEGFTFTPKQQVQNAEILRGTLDLNRRGEEAFIQAGGMQSMVSFLSNPSNSGSLGGEDRAEIGENAIDMTQKYDAQAAASVAAAVNSSRSVSVPETGIPRAGGSGMTQDVVTTLRDFTLNPETLQLEPVGSAPSTTAIRNYNKLNADRLKLVESYGGDLEAFKNDVVRATATAFATKGE